MLVEVTTCTSQTQEGQYMYSHTILVVLWLRLVDPMELPCALLSPTAILYSNSAGMERPVTEVVTRTSCC